MVNRPDIVVVAGSDDPAIRDAAHQLARELDLRFEPNVSGHDLALAVREDRLELRDRESKSGRGISVDFSSLNPRRAARRGGFSRKQPLARAIGKDARIVLDATAGLGHDSALLACMGFQVIAVERSPVIAALLRDGLQRALQVDGLRERLEGRMTIIHADARELIHRGELQFDAVFIDPMFPPKRKASALARKSIRLVRAVVGDDDDAADLLDIARAFCTRVVVKRPTYAPPLSDRPTASLPGTLVRYDVYARQ